MKLSEHDLIFWAAWATSRSMAEALNRMAHTITAGEARLLARKLSLPDEPAGKGAGRRVVLTPHPEDGGRVDDRGWHASRPTGAVEVGPDEVLEGPWECLRCGRESLSGWSLVSAHADFEFVCDRCTRTVL